MKKYLSFFRLRFITGLQYRTAARHCHPVFLGSHGNPHLPGLLPVGSCLFSHDAAGHKLLYLDTAGISGAVHGLEYGSGII